MSRTCRIDQYVATDGLFLLQLVSEMHQTKKANNCISTKMYLVLLIIPVSYLQWGLTVCEPFFRIFYIPV